MKNAILNELKEIKKIIKINNYKRILIQLPDGFKRYADLIYDELYNLCDVFFWGESNFGACDLPKNIDYLHFDALFHFGHTKYLNTGQNNNFTIKKTDNK